LAQVIIDRSPVILFRRDAGEDHKLVYVSDNIKQYGYSADDFYSGRITFKDIVHPEDSERIGSEIEAYTERDLEEYTQYYRIVTQDGRTRWVEDQTSVERDALGNKAFHQGVLVDITERRKAEAELRKSEEKYRRIVESAGEGFLLMDQDLRIIDVNAAYCRMVGYSREELLGIVPLSLATEESRNYIMANREDLLSRDERNMEFDIVTKTGHQVPVLIHGNTLKDDNGRIIGNMAFVTDMSEHKKALRLAGEVQKNLLPKGIPPFPDLDVVGKNVSCDEIGGDYFDFLWRQKGVRDPFQVVVGDIAGHGVDSALLMTSARAFLRMRASQPGTPAEVVTAMNHHLARDVIETGRFMTLFYMSIDSAAASINWVRAGHEPAMVYDPKQDRFEELMGHGVALGVDEGYTYTENQWTGLTPGHIITIGTDGLWESQDRSGRMFGKERLRKIIRSNAHANAETILNAVFETLRAFMNGQRYEDDITLVVIKVKPS
jgi:sigma-B regulation protein RsbU (phosphoserine phosphatase)